MASDQRFYGRYYNLKIGTDDSDTFSSDETASPLDIKFKVNTAKVQKFREGEISILGLSHKRISKFLKLAALGRGRALKEMMPVSLMAGYGYKESLIQIINGYAHYGSVTPPPNMWLTLKVAEYSPFGGAEIEIPAVSASATKSVSEVVNEIIGKINAANGTNFPDLMDYTQGGICSKIKCKEIEAKRVTINGAIDFINSNLANDVTFTIDNGKFVAYDKGDKVAAGPAQVIDKNHGLLSVSGVDAVNGCITTFLQDSSPNVMTKIQLKSELNPQANGEYVLLRKEYEGHYAGPEWYTRFYCSARIGKQ